MSFMSKVKRVGSLPPAFVAKEALRRAKRHVMHKIRKIQYSFSLPKMDDAALLEKANEKSAGALIKKIEAGWFFIGGKNKKAMLSALKKYPEEKRKTLESAEKVLSHTFGILGSGDVRFGKKIPWNRDAVSGKTWENKYYKDIKTIRFDGSDIKVPWELSRCNHFVTLGKAYWYTEDEKYAKEFSRELYDWIERNPPDFSPNWVVTMEAAIRAVNWIWAYRLFECSKAFDESAKKEMIKSLYFHAKHIADNVEYNGEYSGNHYFSNGIGLLYLSIFLAPFPESKKWQEKGIKIILDSMQSQVLDDGVDFEKSLSYHRLVTDFAVHAHILCTNNKINMPRWFVEKLRKMLDFIAHYTKPDGTAPLIGDADDGRLVVLEDGKNINDHRHHLSTGAALFGSRVQKGQAGKFHEESLWLLGPAGRQAYEKVRGIALQSGHFSEGGFAIMRDESKYLIIDCGDIGMRGIGGHGHNDTLGFELFAKDKTFITDSGTYTYSRDSAARAYFKKTSAHSTIEIDRQEMAPFEEKNLWYTKDITNAKCAAWSSTKSGDTFIGQHEGYKRLGAMLVKRKIVFEKKEGAWLFEDTVFGHATHEIISYIHFAPMDVVLEKNSVKTKGRGANICLDIEAGEDAKIELIKDFVSYSYGTRTESKTLKITKKCALPAKVRMRISVL